ncbi:hypothetical protein B0T20DRAFT_59856 [Sordaria brevicollis]|uniref:Uncharacterized protein n=1 Tax=Sordaria brevicollis TaxID=83679 RepID=A0AAE0P3E8_SORBR|nr:hypothetical protein B0T20DRAFT_59856 [Sordaria brevicollis]
MSLTQATETTEPLPVVIIGKRVEIGKAVAEFLQPDIEAIHFIQSLEAACAELPHIFACHAPPEVSLPNIVGTHKYERQPRAVIIGRAFSVDEAEQMRASCVGIAKEPVAWLVSDPSVGPPPLPVDGALPGPEYALRAAVLARSVLAKWLAGDAGDGGKVKDQVLFY